MTNILLIASVLPFFLFGFYIVKKVDEFILENKKRMSEEIEMLDREIGIYLGGSLVIALVFGSILLLEEYCLSF